jgi:hypothetical protein
MKKQRKKEDLVRPSISIKPELYERALQRMEERQVDMFSRYVQDLIKEDTAALFRPTLMAAETHESVDLPQDKTKGKYQNAAKTKAAARAGAKITKLSENLGSGSSTVTTDHSLKTGSQK